MIKSQALEKIESQAHYVMIEESLKLILKRHPLAGVLGIWDDPIITQLVFRQIGNCWDIVAQAWDQ
jgi:hypothetical protein